MPLHWAAAPFLGPNCYGFVNTFDKVALWPDEHGCGTHARGVPIVSHMERLEEQLIRDAMLRHKGNKTRVADELGLTRLRLRMKLTRLGLEEE